MRVSSGGQALSAGGEVSFDGETYSFPPVHSVPGSLQHPHPPILIGGVSNAALRRVVRHGGWLALALGPKQLPERMAKLKETATAEGRRFEDLDLVYKVFLSPGEPKLGPFGERDIGSGSEEQITDDLKTILDAGFQKIIIRYRGDSASAQMEQMERFAADIAPKL